MRDTGCEMFSVVEGNGDPSFPAERDFAHLAVTSAWMGRGRGKG